jgi:hypothetical protein
MVAHHIHYGSSENFGNIKSEIEVENDDHIHTCIIVQQGKFGTNRTYL